MLKDWAAANGVKYRTALAWYHAGTLPVPAEQMPSGTILVGNLTIGTPPIGTSGTVVAYCRVSSSDQKADLERQAGRVVTECGKRGLSVSKTVSEVGSGLNGKRTKLRKLLADPTVTTIVVEHRDRLARFGVEYIEATLSAQGRTLLVLNENEVADDLVRDMTEVMTSLCARLYGQRSARRRAAAAVTAAGDHP